MSPKFMPKSSKNGSTGVERLTFMLSQDLPRAAPPPPGQTKSHGVLFFLDFFGMVFGSSEDLELQLQFFIHVEGFSNMKM